MTFVWFAFAVLPMTIACAVGSSTDGDASLSRDDASSSDDASIDDASSAGDAAPLPDAQAPADAGAPADDAGVPPSCDRQWTDLQIGTELDDQIWGMAVDRDDNLYAGGFELGVTGVTNIEPAGDSRAVVIRIDPTGTVQSKIVLDTGAADTVEDVEIEPASGVVYAVGRTSGAFDGFVNQGQFDLFLAAIEPRDSSLATILQLGDERPQHPARLSLGPNREIGVAGFDDLWIPSNFVAAVEDGFVASFDRGTTPEAGLTQRFFNKVPLTSPNWVRDVVVDRDGSGSMYVASNVIGTAETSGIFVKKLDRDGSEVWSTRISPLGFDAANAVGLSPTNELFVAGATFLPLGQESFGQLDAYVLKVDKNTGAVLWAAQAGSADPDYPTALGFDGAGNIYIAGVRLRIEDNLDLFAMKLDSAGTVLSSWQAGTEELDWATSLVVDGCARAFVAGYTKGALVAGSPGARGVDMFIIRFAP